MSTPDECASSARRGSRRAQQSAVMRAVTAARAEGLLAHVADIAARDRAVDGALDEGPEQPVEEVPDRD